MGFLCCVCLRLEVGGLHDRTGLPCAGFPAGRRLDQVLPHTKIPSILQIDEGTLRGYLRAYQQGGIEQLKTVNWHGSQGELSKHQGTLKNFFCNIRQRLSRMPQSKFPS